MSGWIAISADPISRDAIVQAVATVVTAGLAVWAALYGVRRGTEATRQATERSIKAELELTREQQQARQHEEELSALYALAAELRVNANLAENAIAKWFPIPMQRSALTNALPHLVLLSEDERACFERARIEISGYNALADAALHANDRNSIAEIRNDADTKIQAARELLEEVAKTIEDVASRREEQRGTPSPRAKAQEIDPNKCLPLDCRPRNERHPVEGHP